MKQTINPNSSVRIIWTDKIENYSKEREKDIISHIKNKYKANNVRVEFTATNRISLGISDLNENDVININAPVTQEKIIINWLKDNEIDIKIEDILRLNKRVESNIENFADVTTSNKWKFKKVTLENFLSYKEKTVIDFEKLKGITLISGVNYVGKTTSLVDSLLFLLFSKTTKSKTFDEVINKFIDTDFARVEGEIEIEGKDYKIEREVKRIYKKDGTYSKTTCNLKYLSLNGNGEWKEEDKEEDRNATERKIKENIGNKEEFLMTVMVTGSNIFDIIEALPTERGAILSKFLGLEIFGKKETIAKDLYTEWKKKSKIDKYSSSDLQFEIDESKVKISNNNLSLLDLYKELTEIDILKTLYTKEKDELLTYLNKDIDNNMVNLTEDHFINKINTYKDNKKIKENDLIDIKEKIIPVKEEFDKLKYDENISNKTDLERKILLLENDIKRIEKDVLNLIDGEKCATCGQSLKDVDHSKEISEKKDKVISQHILLKDYNVKLALVEPLIKEMDVLHQQVVLNENNELKSDKIEVEIEIIDKNIKEVQVNLDKYNSDKNKIEVNKGLEEKIRLKNIDIQEQGIFETNKKREINTFENDNTNISNKIKENELLIETIKKEEHISKGFLTYINMVGKNGIYKTIIKNSVPALNTELQRLLNDTAEFTVEIDVNVKNNEVEFWMIDNETQKRSLLISGSGYEKTVASLALRFVFTKINTLPKPSLFLNDEIFSTVSNINLDLIKIFIDKVAETIDNIFIITHNELVKEWCDHIITVSKENNISKLNY